MLLYRHIFIKEQSTGNNHTGNGLIGKTCINMHIDHINNTKAMGIIGFTE